ncbi:serine/threonine transporter SstT [Candidatus Erwinia haradaeae]|uniref:Serine/threonine transporter SstT n=1 Tax=Candidatus Erwinia haradaeae TaxID=1922217 RepID=A0A803GCU5_9GAMM|nr:serine/threonine transporter SstT [Candidatus Erwinia haradaeae]VFP88627.1 Serine/threonine transporter SstT [Candidatus Erwinia haradaeae]
MIKNNNKNIKNSLVIQIFFGLIFGIILAWFSKNYAMAIGVFGDLFVNILKSISPLLVLVLTITSVANYNEGQKNNIRKIVILYLLSTFSAVIIALISSHLIPQTLTLPSTNTTITTKPSNTLEILRTLLMSMVTNPIESLMKANYISILLWGISLGFAFRHSSNTTRSLLNDIAAAVTQLVHLIIKFAPIGICGLVASSLALTGFSVLQQYADLLSLLLGCMFLIALLFNPLIVWYILRCNPYPLVFTCLRESGMTAFFTRSSAANIPVNIILAKKLNLNPETYTVSIPIGANISMPGASITITVLTLAAIHTLGINLDLSTTILFSLIASLCACGASSIASGSLLLIPVICHVFGIPNEVAMQVVAIGFIISILQDSAETALNSSAAILFTAAVCMAEKRHKLNKNI